MKNKKNILIIAVVIIAAVLLFFTGLRQDSAHFLASLLGSFPEKDKEPVVAACPTFYYMLEELKTIGLKTIETNATAESLYYLEQGKADLIIAGRALKPGEPNLLFKKVGPGYDFIFSQGIVISEKDMASVPFYTDLPKNKIIEDFAFISEQNLINTENIYEHINEGIIITLLEDRMEGEIVHIFQEQGDRLRLSRLPRLYYAPEFEEEKIELIKDIIKEN